MRRWMGLGARAGWVLATAAAVLVAASGAGLAAEPPVDAQSDAGCTLLCPEEASLRFSYGIADKASLRFYTFGPRVAYDLPYVPPLLGNRIRIAIEAMGSIIHGDDRPHEGEFALSPLIFDYRYDGGGVFVPFFEGGEGIVLTTLDALRLGGPFEFSSQVGGGAHLFYDAEDAITLGFRMRHISNSGIKDENSGLNTYFFTIGLSHFPGRR
jgi:lipid A 3-O-deacylase PagL